MKKNWKEKIKDWYIALVIYLALILGLIFSVIEGTLGIYYAIIGFGVMYENFYFKSLKKDKEVKGD